MKEDKKNQSLKSMCELNVLIVDDEVVSTDLLEAYLEDEVKSISFTKSGLKAVEICRNNPSIDVVLMDIRLIDLDGYEATRKIRKFNKEILIIAQTAYALVGDQEKALAAGCNDYISKPIDKDYFMSVLKKHLT